MATKRSTGTVLLYPKFQLTIVGTTVAFSLFTGLVCALMVWLGYQDIKNLGLSSQLAEGHPYFQFVEMQSRRIYTALIIAASASAVTSALLMVFITHRIVGPLHRLRSYLSEVARTGKIDSPLTFRKGDYLTDLPEVMNDALMSVRNKSDKSTGKAS